MLILPVNASLDELAEKERKKGRFGGERTVWKNVIWWPYLDCVFNMEPYHTNRRIAVALAVDWTTVEKGEAEIAQHRLAWMFNLVHALLSPVPPEDELKDVLGLPVTGLVVQQNFSPDEPTFARCSEALRGCRDILTAIRQGEQVANSQDDPNTVFYQAVFPAKSVVEELMLPEGYETEREIPDERKVMGITTENLMTNWSMKDMGFWMIQSQRPFWAPLLVANYDKPGGTYWRIVVFDRDGRKLIERRPRWRFVPWVAQLEEHGALDGTVEYLGNEFWRLDKERMNAKDKGERDRTAAEEFEILDQLDRLLPTYKDFDRKFRFDLFCSASMLCLGVNDYPRGMSYAKAAMELAPNDGRPYISWSLGAVHFKETRGEAVQSCLKGMRLPPVSGDGKLVSDSLELLKLELEREGDTDSLAKLADSTTLYVVEDGRQPSDRSALRGP
jgi:hypothetical protein